MDGTDHDVILMGTCTFDPQSLTLHDAAGATLRLRSQSMRVLAELVRRRGAVVSRDALIETVWQCLFRSALRAPPSVRFMTEVENDRVEVAVLKGTGT